jgi:hypothetical protein
MLLLKDIIYAQDDIAYAPGLSQDSEENELFWPGK